MLGEELVRPYGDYADEYLAAGYFPIPASGKRTIKNKHHGKDAPLVTEAEVSKWQSMHPSANIAARLPRDIVGIDVDAYGSKPGEDTLRALEDELGELPETVVSTSRLDGVSGIRLFRIPEHYWSLVWPGKAGPGIDILWHGNRYAIVWPSVHPDTGQTYQWYEQYNGRLDPIDGIPGLDEIPDLPRDWLDHFARVAADDAQADVSDTAEWINQYGAGVPCEYMQTAIRKHADEIPGDAHEPTAKAVYNIAKACVRGHKGGKQALEAVNDAFFDEIGGRSRARMAGAKSEWARLVKGAIRRAQAELQANGAVTVDPCHDPAWTGGISFIRDYRNVLWADDVREEELRWLQKPFFAFGSLTMLDGDPSQAKTLHTQTWCANAARGLPLLPYGEHCGYAIKCGIIGAEDDLGSVVVGRLRAAGWERGSRTIAFHKLPTDKRARIRVLTFPEGAEMVRSFIVSGGLDFVVIDPITAFLGEDVKSHNDASVRMALGPLGDIARDTGACICLVRHLNKDGSMKAMYRGGGSIAFSALARSGLITGQLPDSADGRFGLAQVKCNNAERMNTTLAYSVKAWEDDPAIPVIQWHGEADVSPDELVAGPKKRRGPDADAQEDIRGLLEDLFGQKDTWPAVQIQAILKEAGYRVDTPAVKKVKVAMGIFSRRDFGRGRGLSQPSYWTTKPQKFRGSGSVD